MRPTCMPWPYAQECRGFAPAYGAAQRAELASVLFAARHVMAEAANPLHDGRTGQDLIPLLLQARPLALHFSGAYAISCAVRCRGHQPPVIIRTARA